MLLHISDANRSRDFVIIINLRVYYYQNIKQVFVSSVGIVVPMLIRNVPIHLIIVHYRLPIVNSNQI